jgi:threonine dehydratase
VSQVVVPIGGGGLISGIAYAIKHLKPSCRVIGVQAEGAASMEQSIRQGRPVELGSVATIADGIAVKRPGDLTFQLCREYVDEIVTVGKTRLPPPSWPDGGAEDRGRRRRRTPVAACMFKKVDTTAGKDGVRGLRRQRGCDHPLPCYHQGLSKAGRLVEITTKVMDKPGGLCSFCR